jgi:hypothetical protein
MPIVPHPPTPSPKILIFFLLVLAFSAVGWAAENHYQLYLSGPSVSKHFHPYHDQFNDFHWGLGVEAYRLKKHWLLGVNGHYMFNDSTGRPSYWIGVVPGYFAGSRKSLWGALELIVGGLKKAEYNHNRFSPFAMPYLTVGFNRVGLNVLYIPAIARLTAPILLVQLKVQVYPFHL